MQENAPNKDLKSVKIPRAVHKRLKAESNETGETIETVAARILSDHFARQSSDTSVKIDPGVLDSDKVLTVESEALQISPGERSWVQKLLRILRSRRQGIVTALQHNLTAFHEAADDADQLDALKSAEVPGSGAGLDRSTEGDIEGTAGHRGLGAGDDLTDQELIDRARAITERQAERRRRAKGTPRKTG